MAERRMFAKSVIDSDMFLDLPHSAQLLYYHLSMRADDDGFVVNPKRIVRMLDLETEDLNTLIGEKLIILFDSGVAVIRHWRIHNYIQKDRYKETKCLEEKRLLRLGDNGVYILDTECIHDGYMMDTERVQPVSNVDTQVRLGKDSIGKDSKGKVNKNNNGQIVGNKPTPKSGFVKPTIDDIDHYCKERNNNVDAQQFFDFYECKNWMVGKNKMKDWKAAVRTWERRVSTQQESTPKKRTKFSNFDERTYSDEQLKLLEDEMLNMGNVDYYGNGFMNIAEDIGLEEETEEKCDDWETFMNFELDEDERSMNEQRESSSYSA